MTELAAQIQALSLTEPKLTLAVAESLTSGNVQARIGAISGASAYFLGGITAYNLEKKVRLLMVDREQAASVNCVSAEVARQMAEGASRLFGSDIAAATTGYAEPSPANGVDEPHAYWAVTRRIRKDEYVTISGRVDGPGLDRVGMQLKTTDAVLEALLRLLKAARVSA